MNNQNRNFQMFGGSQKRTTRRNEIREEVVEGNYEILMQAIASNVRTFHVITLVRLLLHYCFPNFLYKLISCL